ncbi:hypothetical protein ABZ799_01545 [Nocardiopsis dassonvillei]|uniref:hypothetical protein n=1 Tax=Nocardiopsis dassonvillei TaxID=2014 RepID=UPI0034075D04
MTTETDAAVARRLVRSHRDEAAYHSTLPVSQSARVWRMDEDRLGYTHTQCGKHFGRFVDPVQTTEHAVAHDKTCEVSRG